MTSVTNGRTDGPTYDSNSMRLTTCAKTNHDYICHFGKGWHFYREI